MRTPFTVIACLMMSAMAGMAPATTTINATDREVYSANTGWINARGEVTNGAVIGQFYCTGLMWSANCGWIDLGHGPTNGWQYGNASANDWGINVERSGALRGLAYGANIGWILFEANGNPRVDRFTGNLSGSAWGANVGWITLSNLHAFARTDRLDPGPDLDNDGLPDAWEYAVSGGTNILFAAGDADDDAAADAAEYLADTDPLNDRDRLRITSLSRESPTNRVTWTVEPTRLYRLEQATAITNSVPWSDSGLGLLPPGSGALLTGVVTDASATTRFYRARSVVPLSP